MIVIKSLKNIGYEQIHQDFQNAFSDYVLPFDLSREQLVYMLVRRGCILDLKPGKDSMKCF